MTWCAVVDLGQVGPQPARLAGSTPFLCHITYAGMQNLVVTLALVFGLGFATDVLNLGWVYDNYLPLFTASLIVSVLGSVALFAASHSPWRERPPLLAAGGDTGYHIYDFFIGRELNPRIGSLDLKEFCELIPGACVSGSTPVVW